MMQQYITFFILILIIIVLFTVSVSLLKQMKVEDKKEKIDDKENEELLKTINLEINDIKKALESDPSYDQTIEIKMD